MNQSEIRVERLPLSKLLLPVPLLALSFASLYLVLRVPAEIMSKVFRNDPPALISGLMLILVVAGLVAGIFFLVRSITFLGIQFAPTEALRTTFTRGVDPNSIQAGYLSKGWLLALAPLGIFLGGLVIVLLISALAGGAAIAFASVVALLFSWPVWLIVFALIVASSVRRN